MAFKWFQRRLVSSWRKDMSWTFVLLSVLIVCCESRSAGKRIRNAAKECTEVDQKEMSTDFNKCINKYTQIHHENMGRAVSKEDSQRYTCQMLKETVACVDVHAKCHTPAEVRSMKDIHIEARMGQFKAPTRDGLDIAKCDVVKEYVESGRADEIQHTTEGGTCTSREVTLVQGKFQDCSHNLSTTAWDRIKDLQDKRKQVQQSQLSVDETNDILEEESRLDAIDEASLVKEDELRPMLCQTLMQIGRECVHQFTKCFSREDINGMRNQHIQSMAGYYSSLYNNIDLSGCEALTTFSADAEPEEELDYEDDYDSPTENHDYDDIITEDYYDEENYDYYHNDNDEEEEEQIPSIPTPDIPTSTVSSTFVLSTTVRVTTEAAPTEEATESHSESDRPITEGPSAGSLPEASEPAQPEHQKRDRETGNPGDLSQPSHLPISEPSSSLSEASGAGKAPKNSGLTAVALSVAVLLWFH